MQDRMAACTEMDASQGLPDRPVFPKSLWQHLHGNHYGVYEQLIEVFFCTLSRLIDVEMSFTVELIHSNRNALVQIKTFKQPVLD